MSLGRITYHTLLVNQDRQLYDSSFAATPNDNTTRQAMFIDHKKREAAHKEENIRNSNKNAKNIKIKIIRS